MYESLSLVREKRLTQYRCAWITKMAIQSKSFFLIKSRIAMLLILAYSLSPVKA